MTASNDTFEFFDSDPLVRAHDLLQELKPKYGRLKKRAIARKALDISENCLEAWLLLIKTYSQFPQARETATQAIAIGQKLYSAPFDAQQGDEPVALNSDQLSLLEIYKLLGELHFQQEEYTEAIECFLAGLKMDPSDPVEIKAALCLTYLHANKHEEATALTQDESFEKSLASRVAQAYLHFLSELPEWTPDQMDEIHDLLFGRTLWQWMHERSNSMKRHFRAINHANPFFAAFMLNPSCSKIKAPDQQIARHASEALHVAKSHQSLWMDEELPMKLLEEYPWENPSKRDIIDGDKPLLRATIKQLEEHREKLRNSAERDYLGDQNLF